ncbi:hypothetical protein ACP70R_037228 [Stipagrostis hirtigluma subsp. patula]
MRLAFLSGPSYPNPSCVCRSLASSSSALTLFAFSAPDSCGARWEMKRRRGGAKRSATREVAGTGVSAVTDSRKSVEARRGDVRRSTHVEGIDD